MMRNVKAWMIGILVGLMVSTVACTSGPLAGQASATVTPVSAVQEEPEVAESSPIVATDALVVPLNKIQLSLPSSGRVVEMLVKEGDLVEEGQLLAKLDGTRQQSDVTLAEAAVAQAEAGVSRAEAGVLQAAALVSQAESGLLSAQAMLAAIQAGPLPQEVALAQADIALAQARAIQASEGPSSAEIAAAQAQVQAAQAVLTAAQAGPSENAITIAQSDLANSEASLQQAQAAYDRVAYMPDISARPESLALQRATNDYIAAQARYSAATINGSSEAEVASANAQIQAAQAQLGAVQSSVSDGAIASSQAEIQRAQAQLSLVQAGARPETIASAEAEVSAASSAIDSVKAAKASAEAALISAQAQLVATKTLLAGAQAEMAQTSLLAPTDGTIATLSIMQGEYVNAGQQIAWLADLSNWVIEARSLDEFGIVRVKPGDPVTVTFDALPGTEFSGSVARIQAVGNEDAEADMTTYTAIITLDDIDPRLRWNMSAIVTIHPTE